jgi:predicted metal-binding protein
MGAHNQDTSYARPICWTSWAVNDSLRQRCVEAKPMQFMGSPGCVRCVTSNACVTSTAFEWSSDVIRDCVMANCSDNRVYAVAQQTVYCSRPDNIRKLWTIELSLPQNSCSRESAWCFFLTITVCSVDLLEHDESVIRNRYDAGSPGTSLNANGTPGCAAAGHDLQRRH